MKITVWTRNRVRTSLEPSEVSSQVRHVTAAGCWVAVTMRDGRCLQLQSLVPGVEYTEHDTTQKKGFLQKLLRTDDAE